MKRLDSRALLAEFAGTFALVFVGTGAIVLNDNTGGAVTHLGVSLAFGLVVTTMIYLLGRVSGAHINPAVTLAFWSIRRISSPLALGYVASQFLGGICASGVLFIPFPAHGTLGATLPDIGGFQTAALEGFLTFFLVSVVLSFNDAKLPIAAFAGLAIGAVVGLEAFFAGPFTGASMNPARSLGPALFSGNLGTLWIYFAGPGAGAFLATLSCRGLRGESCCARRRSPPGARPVSCL